AWVAATLKHEPDGGSRLFQSRAQRTQESKRRKWIERMPRRHTKWDSARLSQPRTLAVCMDALCRDLSRPLGAPMLQQPCQQHGHRAYENLRVQPIKV